MELIELSIADKGAYNRFVAQSPTGSFLQSWDWGDWQARLGREAKRFFVKNGQDIADAVQLLKMPLFGKKYYWYAPYGPVMNNEAGIMNYELLLTRLIHQFPDAVFIRVEPADSKSIIHDSSFATKSVNIQPAVTMVVDLAGEEEKILAEMHSKTRYNIRLAERHGVAVEHELAVTPGHGLYFKEVVDLIVQTQVRQSYRGHGAGYYKELVDFFAVQNQDSDLKLTIYRALYNKELLACAIMMDFGKTRMYLFGGSAQTHREVMAPYALHWQAMQDARHLGLLRYDLGGSEVASGGERGFTRFKQGFGGRTVNYAGAYDLVNDRIWYFIYKQARRLNRLLTKTAA